MSQAPFPAQSEPNYPPISGWAAPAYAHWGKRVGASIIDGLVIFAAEIPFAVGVGIAFSGLTSTIDPVTGESVTSGEVNPIGVIIAVIGFVLLMSVFIWNVVIKQGRTGYTVGKGVLGIELISEQTGQPIGAGMTFARYLLHILDGLPCYLGYLWPLWDAKRQTFADKIVGSVVIEQPRG